MECESIVRALIADDHPLYRQALKTILASVCGDVMEIEDACDYDQMRRLVEVNRYELILTDLLMPGGGNLSGLVDLVRVAQGARIIVVSGIENSEVVERVKSSGIADFVAKTLPAEEIASAIRRILQSDAKSTQQAATPKDLSPRERECLLLLSKGLRNDMIAHRLNVSVPTVELHLANARRKLGAATREQAIATAVLLGLLDP